MKTIKKIIGSTIALLGFVVGANAQSTATASTTAVLVAPIAISKTIDMHFGTLAASGTAGTVDLNYDNSRVASTQVKLLAGAGLEKAAVFNVTGEGTSGFAITIPTGDITLTGSVTGTMIVNNITADLGASSNLSSGAATIKVKARLTVGAGQPAGTYTNAAGLFVTVNYN